MSADKRLDGHVIEGQVALRFKAGEMASTFGTPYPVASNEYCSGISAEGRGRFADDLIEDAADLQRGTDRQTDLEERIAHSFVTPEGRYIMNDEKEQRLASLFADFRRVDDHRPKTHVLEIRFDQQLRNLVATRERLSQRREQGRNVPFSGAHLIECGTQRVIG